MSSIILRSLLVTICSLCIERTLSTNVQRIWTYQSTIRVDSMGMEGNSFAMHGRGLTTIVQGSDLIYQDATAVPKPSTVWVGSCVYETDENFVRCVNRKSPIYNANSNLPVCTTNDADPTILVADPYCDGPGPPASYKFHSQNYDPPAPGSDADNVGDEYGAHVSLAGDLETGALLAVGAPSTYDSATSTFYETHGAVYMHSGEYKRWTENQKLVADDSNQFLTANRPNFGKIVEIDRVTSRTTLVSCPQCVSSSTTEGSVYVYKSENGKSWSKTQQLSADDATTSDYAFGLNVKVHDDFAMIAADGLSPQRGALYMFREERHSVYKNGVYNGQWTQQQKLVPHDAYIRGQGTQWGGSADMHGKTLVVGMKEEPSHGTMTGAAYVYKSSKTMEIPHHQAIRAADIDMKPKPIPMHKWWTQVQKLYPADPHTYRMFGNEVAIWGDVIAVMGIGESLSDSDWSTPGTYYQFGSVYMFARDGFSSDSWTQQQKLYNPDANDGTIFSQSVDDSYQANTIGAGDLDYNRFGIPRLHGSSLAVSSYGDTWYSAFTYFMTDNVDWKCLLITVGDGMGDGWGDSRLVATSPSGPSNEVKHDTFSQFCDSYNYDKVNEKIPLSRKFQETYRYCPLSSQDEGDYIFEILGNPRGSDKGKPTDDLYWREIYWEVKNELNNELFRGDARTKMTFNWGKKDFFFTDVKIEREFIPPDVCSQCNVWEGLKNDRHHQPKQKPAAKMIKTDADVSRRLNLYPTPSPTTSLSPTMTWDIASVTDQWMFYMGRQTSPAYGSTTTWFDKNKNGTGTHFYIYDSNGQNITEPLIWGQLCELTGTIADSCDTQVLTVGGTYTLRVTGGMDYRRNDIQWKFCNIAGTAQQTLVFNVYSSTCLPIALYDSEAMCEKNGFQVTTSATAVLKGLVGLYSEQRDSSIVKKAFKTMFEPFVASSIRIVVEEENLYAASTLDDITLRVEATFDSIANKVNVESLDGLHNFESALVQKLSYLDDNNLISSIMISSAMDVLVGDTHNVMSGNSIECHITNVQLVNAVPKTLENIARERVHNSEFAEDVDVEAAVNVQNVKWDHTTEVEYNILNAEAIGGYVIVGFAVIAGVVVVLVSWHQSYKRRTHYQGTADDEDDRLTVSLSGV